MTDVADTTEQAAVPGWEGILDPGEKIVWQGRPDPRFNIAAKEIPTALFSLFFTGFAVFWMVLAAQAGAVFWMFGLIHFSAGLGIFWKAIVGATARRRRTWYTLTDRRAFVATEIPLRSRVLKSYPITPQSPITYRAGRLADIHFASEWRTGNKGRRYTADIGFERIAEGEKVIALLRKAQRGEEDA